MSPLFIEAYLESGRRIWIPDAVQVPFGPQQDYRVVVPTRGSAYTRAVLAVGVDGLECVGWMEIPD